jgi:hypothetical protein
MNLKQQLSRNVYLLGLLMALGVATLSTSVSAADGIPGTATTG